MTDSSIDGVERRKSFRLDMEKELVDISWTDENGVELKKKLACLDFSRGGLRLDSDVAIAVKTPVMVLFRPSNPNARILKSEVLRCIKQDTGWFDIALFIEK